MIDIEIRYVIETPASKEAKEYAGVFTTRERADHALATWSRFDGLRKCAVVRPRIIPTLYVNPQGQLEFVGGTF